MRLFGTLLLVVVMFVSPTLATEDANSELQENPCEVQQYRSPDKTEEVPHSILCQVTDDGSPFGGKGSVVATTPRDVVGLFAYFGASVLRVAAPQSNRVATEDGRGQTRKDD